jgi:hypothetical protein
VRACAIASRERQVEARQHIPFGGTDFGAGRGGARSRRFQVGSCGDQQRYQGLQVRQRGADFQVVGGLALELAALGPHAGVQLPQARARSACASARSA